MAFAVRRDRAVSRIGVLLGIGLGGFVDGIVLHQIVGWHNMGSAVLPPATMDAMRTNMRWDGMFHAGVWLVMLLGVYRLLNAARNGVPLPRPRTFNGQLLTGWGLFNLVEGIVDHHVLNIHHVRDIPAHVPLYDWIFLAVAGVGFMVMGTLMQRERIGGRSR